MKNQKLYGFIGIVILFCVGLFLIYNQSNKIDKTPQTPKQEKTTTIKKPEVFVEKDEDITISNKLSQELIYKRAGLAKKHSTIDVVLPPEETFRMAGKRTKSLEEWKKVLSPKDQNADKYVILPSQGLIVPVISLKEKNPKFQDFINGKEVDINPYLKDGAFEIPGTSVNKYGEPGNKVISGHSSYFKKDNGRYKTHFQKIIEMNVGQEIWIFEKDANGKFKRSIYKVFKTYNTDYTDVSILDPSAKKIITLFTCTPIGGLSGRWVVQGEFIRH
ncbi:sortase [Candidatus Gracilibacteria bacterium]|nr:sortase [Candidatus Gracilibacteria bacterium]